jgi:CHAT domain-containing protein
MLHLSGFPMKAQAIQVPDLGPDTGLYVEAWKAYRDGNYERALQLAEYGLEADKRSGAARGVAEALNLIGTVQYKKGDYVAALLTYQEAEKAAQESDYELGLARDWSSLGSTYYRTGRFALAKQYYEKSLELRKKLNAGAAEVARTLNDIANVDQQLGNFQQTLLFRRQSLRLFERDADQEGVADVLNDIAWTYDEMGNEVQALVCIRQSLNISQKLNLRVAIIDNLESLGIVEGKLGRYDHALRALNEAYAGYKSFSQEDEVSQVLNDMGQIYLRKGQNLEALSLFEKATKAESLVGNVPIQITTLVGIMRCWRSLNEPLTAVFFGKRAVNLLQGERIDIGELDTASQKSFLASKESVYRELAGLLIDRGRLPEAQQVLGLLKRQEYSDYVRGEAANTFSTVTLTPAETQAEADYQRSTALLVSRGEQWAELKADTSRTPEQEQQFKDLSNQLDAAGKGLDDFYARLYVLFGKDSAANKQMADVKGDVSALEDQIAETPHTVALYTMVTADHYRVIVITAAATVAREYAITGNELNKKVADFEQVLRNPGRDPKPLAHELYTILIGPVKADLDQAKAETLVWSLDGVLRYVPIGALYDGNQYLVENYNTVTITPASITHLDEKPDVSKLGATAMGISQKYEAGLPALPAVTVELDDVVKDANVQGANGALPGTILLDGQFTESAMEKQLDGRPGVVHIASHFVFRPGDDSQSYLLLAGKDEGGSGFHLTVADFRDNKNLVLRHTDLLTLSACDTGMSGNASNGREVDGLGTTAQLKGARAVLSSLWEVNDASTGQLMGDFYKRWADGGGRVEKVEALRQAQLDLLLGRVKPGGGGSGRGFAGATSGKVAPVLTGYGHPYYWAPFVLMGNWK